MICEVCGDNRFEIIEKAKTALLESTNIETSKDEMKVIDDFLFRCWQMGWLGKYDSEEPQTIPTFTESAEAYKAWTGEEMSRPHGRLIDADFEEQHYTSMLLNPSPDVTAKDRENAKIILGALKMAKTVSADRPHGEWIECLAYNPDLDVDVPYIECDQCGHRPYFGGSYRPKYCEECGAKMDGNTDKPHGFTADEWYRNTFKDGDVE